MATANFTMIKGLKYIYILNEEDIYGVDEEGKIDYDLLEEHYLSEIKESIKNINFSLAYHTIELLDGYYGGIQLYFKESFNSDDFNASDSDLIRDRRAVIYFMELIALRHNFKKITLIAQASNGEAFYEYVK